METYFSLLPLELSASLLKYFRLNDLVILIPKLNIITSFRRLFDSKTFWRNNISSLAEVPDKIHETVINIFTKIKSTYDKYGPRTEWSEIINGIVAYLAEEGYDTLLYRLLETERTRDMYDTAMKYAAIKPYRKIINDLKTKAEYYTPAMYAAAANGHIDIVKDMLNLWKKRGDKDVDILDHIVVDAAANGHADIVKLLIDNGARQYDWILRTAIRNGHINIAYKLLDLGLVTPDAVMMYAGEGGLDRVVEDMLRRGATDYNNAMFYAASKGHSNIVKKMLERGANEYDEAIRTAITGRYNNIANMIRSYKRRAAQLQRIP